ncbi:YihY/virulence factor BrkB family protein [Halomicronema sp. CCY15110]|uniref:YihY/virulence factor BrkB family protein n=1 Tax=Halomicronema sp. CCY15110 TaxID=2767773 RepID=UPI00194DED27|nr:YihY/virulence factor BrkB family protein [Halomicronema sp. CCY15110]
MLPFLKNQVLPSRGAQLFIQTGLKWQKDKCLEMGAALSYYALFSLFPITLVLASILGFLLGPDTDTAQKILTFTQDSLPPEAFEIVQQTLLKLNRQSVGAGIVGFSISFFAASSVFAALDRSVDRIWKAEDDDTDNTATLKDNATNFLGKRLFAFGLVISTSMLLLLSLLSNIVIRVVLNIIDSMERSLPFVQVGNLPIAKALQISSSFLLVALAVLLLFRFLPSTRTPWKDLWPGTLFTTALLIGLQQLVSRNIINIGGQYQSYGAIGGVMILMLWIYLTCQIFFFGCVMSYVYAHLFGSRRRHDLIL